MLNIEILNEKTISESVFVKKNFFAKNFHLIRFDSRFANHRSIRFEIRFETENADSQGTRKNSVNVN